MKKVYIGLGIVAVIVMFLISSYNGMVIKSEDVDNGLANLDSMLKRRTDLIPNLVETVKGYASHESSVIDSVTEARARLAGAESLDEKMEANDELSGAISRLLVVVENYPDLKASTTFINLQDELAGTENRISTARKDYNDTVKLYNLTIKRFPNNIIAGMFGFETGEYFEVSDEDKEVPEVDFN